MHQPMDSFSSAAICRLSTIAALAVICSVQFAIAGEVNNKLVSRAAGEAGAVGNGTSAGPEITPDGRFVVFESSASNLIPGGTTVRQVYLRDLQTGALELISQNTTGGNGNNVSYQAHVSADARYVSFTSAATDLVAGDTNGFDDIFVRDRTAGTTTRVSLGAGGVQADNSSFQSRISGDGAFVLFESRATNLVAGDTNSMSDGFLWVRATGVVERVTLSSTGGELSGSPNGRNEPTSLSDNGQFIVFQTDFGVANAVPDDTNSSQDVFLRDRTAGTTTRLSVNPGTGEQGNNHSLFPFISRDGSTVVFTSFASNLVSGDTNGVADVFLLKRNVSPFTIQRITNGDADSQQSTVSSDGRYVAFASQASNLVSDDTNTFGDQFLYDASTGEISLLSRASDGQPGNGPSGSHELPGQQFIFCCYAYVTDNGRFVAYDSDATNLVFDDTNARGDIFVHDRVPGVIARAGDDQTATEGQLVTLDGSASVGPALVFAWEQTAGPAIITPSSAASSTFSFTAPSVTSPTIVTIRLVVTGSDGVSSFDTVNITVRDSSDPGGLDGTLTDTDGDGFPDDVEIAGGTNPRDPASKPLPFTPMKVQMKASFKTPSAKDTLKFVASIDMPANFTPAGLGFTIKVPGTGRAIFLDAKGRAPKGNTALKLKFKKPKKGTSFAGGPVGFSPSLKAAGFMPALGLKNETVKTGTGTFWILMIINGQPYAGKVNAALKAKQDSGAQLRTK
jgi:Tol biopolymer transport system component